MIVRIIFLGSILIYSGSTLAQKAPVSRPTEESVLIEKTFIDANREKLLGNNEEAIYLFNEVLRKDKDNHTSYYELAKLYRLQKQSGKALEKAQKAAELNPSNIYYAQLLAELYENNAKYDDAAKTYEVLAKNYPETDSIQFQLGFFYIKANKLDQALKLYDKLEKKEGIMEEVTLNKHYIYAKLGKTKNAAAELETLIKNFPENPDYYEMLGKYYSENGMAEKANEVYIKLNKIAPNDPRAALRAADGYKKRGDDAGYLNALSVLFESPEVSIDDKIGTLMPYLENETSFENKALTAALLNLSKKALETHPNDSKAHCLYADILFGSGQIVEAATEYRIGLRLNANNPDAWRNMINALAQMRDYEQLGKDSETYMDLYPNDVAGYYFSGLALLHRGSAQEAINTLLPALAISRSNPTMQSELNAMLGAAYDITGKTEKAEEAFKNAIKNAPNSPVVIREYGWHQYKIKDFDGAKKTYSNLINSSNPNTEAEVLERYGDILYRLNQTDEAVKYWQKAAEKSNPHSATLDKKISTKTIVE